MSVGKLVLLAAALGSVAFGLVEFRGLDGYTGLSQRRDEVLRLERENAHLREEIDRLDKRVDHLNRDPAAQELEIRKRYGLVKPGETVYLLQNKSSKSPTSVK
jgi:cell division protein FtsB